MIMPSLNGKTARVANFYTDFEARLKDVEFVAGPLGRAETASFPRLSATLSAGMGMAKACVAKSTGLKGRAISGPHGYEQIPALIERSKQWRRRGGVERGFGEASCIGEGR